jgi:PASTA domain
MRSEAEMLELVRKKVRMRRSVLRLRAGLGIAVVTCVVVGIGVTLAWYDSNSEGGVSTEIADSSAGGLVSVPDLAGLDVESAYESLRAAGFTGNPGIVDLHYVADNEVAKNVIIRQEKPPGSLVEPHHEVALFVSAGGPAVGFGELPLEDQAFARGIAGFDEAEPVLVVLTEEGNAYKTDAILFGPCGAVDVAYRTFPDPLYDRRCY